ncbi:alginate lyase family protein [Paenibacillus barengoltzii]|uniref:Heparinase II/III-like protein n=1 Tax=Paenibacillus barengoltzii J12 TaxID=935846 RepID=A0ABY1LT58_9BACL|nr:alginate lyase family protein [Paenibacillus barengoltzii]SME98604.1 Heparinase II/III-like protein [Paenibacillus barengoltzii J12]
MALKKQGSLETPRFYWNEEDRTFIVDACRKHWPEEVEQVLHRADLAARNTFIFTHRWDMERCEEEVTFENGINWDYRHNEDLEWLVMLNRARYMGELGQAYWLTGEESYAQAYIRLLKDWMTQNPLTEAEVRESVGRSYNVKDTWRKLDSGIRITHWLKGYYCVRRSKHWGTEEEALFLEAIRRHGMYLSIAYTSHDRQSNWGFLETNGLFQLALLFPEVEEAATWLQTAIERLVEMCQLQVYDDGLQNEQSSMYHHEVLHCLFESVWLAELNRISLPSVLHDTLNRMFTASLTIVQPDGRQPNFSDSDSTDIRDVLARGAVLYRRGDLKSQAYSVLDYDGIWYFTQKGFELYEKLEVKAPDFVSKELTQSGYAFMRSDWQRTARYLWFDHGHMDVIRAHGHDDALHISLFAYGREFLVDPGRCTYMENRDRQYFKESLQHNTVSVDGQTISEYVDSWKWNHVARSLGQVWRTTPEYDYAQGGHDGYWRLPHPVQLLRQILFVKPDYWVVVDTCRSHGDAEHAYALPFHLAEGLEVRFQADGHLVIGDAGGGEGPVLRILPLHPVKIDVEPSWISRNYNEKTPSCRAILRQSGQGFTQFVTVLYPAQRQSEAPPVIRLLDVLDSYGHPVPGELATALSITHDGGEDAMLFSHQGPRSYQFAGVHLCGDVLLVRRSHKAASPLRSYIVNV